MRRRMAAPLFVVCVALAHLTACDMILGIGDLDAPSTRGDGGAEWSLDAGSFESGSTYVPPPSRTDGGDANSGTKRRVFVTAETYEANFGNVAGAHAKCRAAASGAKLGGDWVAWISAEGSKAIDNLTFDGRYELLNGTAVAANKAGLLKGTLEAAIDVTQSGEKVGDLAGVWTGTKVDGTLGPACDNWKVKTFGTAGLAGSRSEKDKRWTDLTGDVISGGWNCSWTGHLYCFER